MLKQAMENNERRNIRWKSTHDDDSESSGGGDIELTIENEIDGRSSVIIFVQTSFAGNPD